jgi:formylglycine-generating enzyme required for sulfatase activity
MLTRPTPRTFLTAFVLLGGFGAAVAAGSTPEMVRIPAGTFRQGSDDTEPGSYDDETPRLVRLSRPFLLGRTEVTQVLWVAVMGGNPSYYARCPECPVDNVSWFDAVLFCNRLSARDGFRAAYAIAGSQVSWDPRSDGYRLPTEAEWEYACRAGTTTPFSTGSCLSTEQANFDGYLPLASCPGGLNRGEPLEVAGFPANAWGLRDMHGNSHEWCWDWYAPYPTAGDEVVNPSGPSTGQLRVVRGGSWWTPAARCRSAKREPQAPTSRYDMIGLRLARTPAD